MELSEYLQKVAAYRQAMSIAKSMEKSGIISEKEYGKIDTIIAQKYGISSCSIFRQNA